MNFVFNAFKLPHTTVRRRRAAGYRHWLPVIILLALVTTGMGVMSEVSARGGMVVGYHHTPTDSCCHHNKPLVPGPKTGCLHAPSPTVNDYLIDRWNLPLSAETDMPDIDPVMIKTNKSLAVFIAAAGPILRPASERQQTFTPLYLAHQSLIC